MQKDEERITAFLFGRDLDELKKSYSEVALDHLMNPRNWGIVDNADGYVGVKGPCGDTIYISLKVKDYRITRCKFDTDGCVASVICASVVTVLSVGKTLEEAAKITQESIIEYFGGLPNEDHHCALLASKTLKKAIETYIRPKGCKKESGSQ